jgi:hypothetical protein
MWSTTITCSGNGAVINATVVCLNGRQYGTTGYELDWPTWSTGPLGYRRRELVQEMWPIAAPPVPVLPEPLFHKKCKYIWHLLDKKPAEPRALYPTYKPLVACNYVASRRAWAGFGRYERKRFPKHL